MLEQLLAGLGSQTGLPQGGDNGNETWVTKSTGESLEGLRQVVTHELCLDITLAAVWMRGWGPGWRLLQGFIEPSLCVKHSARSPALKEPST